LPNAKVLEQKQQLVAELSEKLNAAVTGVVVDYKGTTVADDTALRKELREAGVNYFVVKNTMLSRAVEGTNLEGMKASWRVLPQSHFLTRITPLPHVFSANLQKLMITSA